AGAFLLSQASSFSIFSLQDSHSFPVLYWHSFWRSAPAAHTGCGYPIGRPFYRYIQGTVTLGAFSSVAFPRTGPISCRPRSLREPRPGRALLRWLRSTAAAG